MRTILKHTALSAFLLTLFVGLISCEASFSDELESGGSYPVQPSSAPEWWGDEFFYHYGKRVYLRRMEDQILLKTVPNIHWSQIRSKIDTNQFFVSVARWTERSPIILVIDREGNPISLTSLKSFSEMPEIVSASYVYMPWQFKPGIHIITHGAFTDELIVKLKPTTTVTQLQMLAEQNGIVLGERCRFVNNQFSLFVPKTSELNVIQVSKLFYETGLFENSSPDFFMINGAGSLRPQTPTPFFYYYATFRIYLQQVTNKILLTFAPNTEKEQILAIIESNASLRPIFDINESHSLRFVPLESISGNAISSEIFESFRQFSEVVYVSYVYQIDGSQGFLSTMDELLVRLMPRTTHEQLQKLAEKYNFTIGEGSQFTRNVHTLHICKTSEYSTLKTSNLLYNTGLFEWTEPNFVMWGFDLRGRGISPAGAYLKSEPMIITRLSNRYN